MHCAYRSEQVIRLARWCAPIRNLEISIGIKKRIPNLLTCKKILIIRPDEIGDVVLTSPFFRNLRRSAPKAKISVITNQACQSLLENCPYIDEVQSLPFMPTTDRKHCAKVVLHALILKLFKYFRGFDLILLPRLDADWYNSELVAHLLAGNGVIAMNSASFITWSNNPPAKIGLADAYYSVHKPQSDVLSNLEFLKWCGGVCETQDLEFWHSQTDVDGVENWLSKHALGVRRLVFHPPGGRSSLRRWPLGRSRDFAEKVLASTDFSIIVVGGLEDEFFRREFSSLEHSRFKMALGEFSLPQLGALIRSCGYFVGGDSGPLHIAASVGAKTIGIFGPGSETRFQPWSSSSTILSKCQSCSPDNSKSYEACCQKCIHAENLCLSELSEVRVLNEIARFLNSSSF